MWIAGVKLPDSAAARLVVLLSRAGHSRLVQRLGIAVDANVDQFGLLPGEAAKIIGVLNSPAAGLEELRAVLTERVGYTRGEMA